MDAGQGLRPAETRHRERLTRDQGTFTGQQEK
jgi:hypothetical protein